MWETREEMSKWKTVEDSYNFKANLIDSGTLRILGHVSGSRYQESDGWFAMCELPDVRLGRYETLDAAKQALEACIKESR